MRHEIFSTFEIPKTTVSSIGCSDDINVTHFGPSRRPALIIHYCITGKGFFNARPVNTGEGFVILPDQLAEYHAAKENPWKFLWLIIYTDSPAFFVDLYNVNEFGIFQYSFQDVLEKLCRKLVDYHIFSASPLECMTIFLELLAHHTQENTSPDSSNNASRLATTAKNYIDNNYFHRPSVASLATKLNISQAYLYRIFEKEFGMSPKEYLNHCCLEQAKTLLLHSKLNITQIAAAVGYNDVLAFSAFFSKKEGCSPTAFRNR